jgi:hypothetical protein
MLLAVAMGRLRLIAIVHFLKNLRFSRRPRRHAADLVWRALSGATGKIPLTLLSSPLQTSLQNIPKYHAFVAISHCLSAPKNSHRNQSTCTDRASGIPPVIPCHLVPKVAKFNLHAKNSPLTQNQL